MRTIWQSLAWKEWHEHKWKFASIVAILWTTAALSLFYSKSDSFGLAAFVLSFSIIPMAVFVGLSAAANERSRGTLAFLQALPAPMWQFALMKLFFGLLILVLSIALTIPIFYAWNLWLQRIGESSALRYVGTSIISGNFYVDIGLFCAALAASFFIWSAAAGVNRKDEVSAGAMALAVMVGWYLMLVIGGYVLFGRDQAPQSTPVRNSIEKSIIVCGLATAPAGFTAASTVWLGNPDDLPYDVRLWYVLLIAVTATITHGALAGWYVRRFGRTSNLEVRSPQVAVPHSSRPGWLSPPRRSAFAAIAWKQFRESGPLVLAGMAGVIGVSLGIIASDPGFFLSRRNDMANMFAVVGATLGCATTLIVGIGVCLYDVGPHLNTFWRSRPINPNLWFWSKFATGLIVLAVALYVPLLTIIVALHSDASRFLSDFSATAILAAQIALFAAAVATTCLVRHAVYGAILSIPLMYLGGVIVSIALKWARIFGWIANAPSNIADLSESQLASGFLLTFVVSTVLAWLAMRYDWGRKSRY